MQIIIDIDKEYYKAITEIPNHQCTADMLIIKNGTPLPKDHGDLIDRQELLKSTMCKTFGLRSVDIENAPTIVEADTESKV